jgi:hypothetical protein
MRGVPSNSPKLAAEAMKSKLEPGSAPLKNRKISPLT